MGFFDLFRKKPVFTDLVFGTRELKNASIAPRLQDSLSKNNTPIIVYHFALNHKFAINLLQENKIAFEEHHDLAWLADFNPANWRNQPKAFLMNASVLSSLLYLNTSRLENSDKTIIADVYLLEHYPLLPRDELILSLNSLPCFKFNFMAFVSLEEPLLKVFGGERISGIMEKLGMAKDECIIHPWVSKAIVNAQKQMAEKASGDSECESSETWYGKHYPGIR